VVGGEVGGVVGGVGKPD